MQAFFLDIAYLQLISLPVQLCLITLGAHGSHSDLPLSAPTRGKMMGRDIAGPGNQSSRMKEKKVALISLPKKDLKLFGVIRRI